MPNRFDNTLRQVALVGFLIGLWQAVGSLSWSDTTIIPSPGQVVRAIAEMTYDGQMIVDATASLRRVSVGFLLAVITGCIVGGLLAWLGHHADWLGAPCF